MGSKSIHGEWYTQDSQGHTCDTDCQPVSIPAGKYMACLHVHANLGFYGSEGQVTFKSLPTRLAAEETDRKHWICAWVPPFWGHNELRGTNCHHWWLDNTAHESSVIAYFDLKPVE